MHLLCWLVLGAALALRLPALSAELQDDDYIQAAMLDGAFLLQRGPLDLYWFGGNTEREARALLDHGYHPWWTHPEHRVAMMRPLASGLLALEHRLDLPVEARRVVSIACLLLCLWAGRRFLSALVPEEVALLAVALYALDESHAAPIHWLANRSTLISTALAFAALAAHVRMRAQAASSKSKSIRTRFASYAWLLAAFVSGEYGFFALGYIAAFELFGARDDRRVRASHLGAALALGAIVTGVAAALGYGVRASGYYISPFGDPLRFLQAIAARLPALSLDLVLGIPARYVDSGIPLREWLLDHGFVDALTWHNLPNYRLLAPPFALVALVLLGQATRALLARRADLASLAWLLPGALLALIPAAGALPSARITSGSALGVAVLLAALLAHSARLLRARKRVPAALLVAFVVGAHALLPAARAYDEALGTRIRAHTTRHWALTAELPDPLPHDAQIWLTSASDFTTAIHVPWVRWHAGLPRLPNYRLLSGAGRAHDFLRIDDRTLEMQILSSDPGRAFTGSLYRPENAPLLEGAAVSVPGLTAIVVASVDGDPWRVRFVADRSLDDPSIVLLCPQPSGIKRCAMPAVGYALRLPRAPVPWVDPNASFSSSLRKW